MSWWNIHIDVDIYRASDCFVSLVESVLIICESISVYAFNYHNIYIYRASGCFVWFVKSIPSYMLVYIYIRIWLSRKSIFIFTSCFHYIYIYRASGCFVWFVESVYMWVYLCIRFIITRGYVYIHILSSWYSYMQGQWLFRVVRGVDDEPVKEVESVAVCCGVLQCVAVCCSVLQRECCRVLQTCGWGAVTRARSYIVVQPRKCVIVVQSRECVAGY